MDRKFTFITMILLSLNVGSDSLAARSHRDKIDSAKKSFVRTPESPKCFYPSSTYGRGHNISTARDGFFTKRSIHKYTNEEQKLEMSYAYRKNIKELEIKQTQILMDACKIVEETIKVDGTLVSMTKYDQDCVAGLFNILSK